MKTSRNKNIILTICLVACLLFCLGNDGCEEEGKNSQNGKIYSIDYFPSEESPQIAYITALECIQVGDSSQGSYYTYGCGNCFKAALKELSERYEIGETTTIIYECMSASVTKELIIHIKPKE